MNKVIEDSGWQDQSIEVTDIIAAQDKKFVKNVGQYNVSNPHPLYGKDPNIINEFGHTMYPKWVDSKVEGKRVIVKNPMEEAQHTEVEFKTSVPSAPGWGE